MTFHSKFARFPFKSRLNHKCGDGCKEPKWGTKIMRTSKRAVLHHAHKTVTMHSNNNTVVHSFMVFNPKSSRLKLAESPLSQHLQLSEIAPLVDCFYWDMFLINLEHPAHRCKEECVCEACRNTTVSMERVCSLSSPDSSLSTSSFVSNSLQSSPSVSPCKRPNRLASTQTIQTSRTASV